MIGALKVIAAADSDIPLQKTYPGRRVTDRDQQTDKRGLRDQQGRRPVERPGTSQSQDKF